jgi:hypothetical protein
MTAFRCLSHTVCGLVEVSNYVCPAALQTYHSWYSSCPLYRNCVHTQRTVTVDPPPGKVEFANFGQTARVQPVMSAPPEGKLLRSWLPPQSLQQAVTELLPSNLVPKLDPCLGKFYISPIQVGYCLHAAYTSVYVSGSLHIAVVTCALTYWKH